MHWTLEVDETFLKVVQKNSIRSMKPCRSSCSCFKVPTKPCSCFRIRCSNVGSFSLGIFWRDISWEEGEIVLQDWVLHTVSECEILHETNNNEFQIQKNDTYMKPASTSFTFEISQHKLWMRNSIKKPSNNKFQIQNIMQKLKMWKIKRHQRLPVSNS